MSKWTGNAWSLSIPPQRRRLLLWIALLFSLAAGAGSLFGYLLTIDIPQVTRLEDYRPPIGTKIYSDVGNVVFEFAGQKRILIEHEQIPEVLRSAIIATEDARFYRHFGIDPRAILRAAIRDLISMRFAQGASTITQQLARNLFLQADKTLWRKVQEAVLALQIEKVYTKPEILEFYCNQIYMGHGRYGLEAAARFYFGKSATDLDLAEAALLAGILQRPEALSPFKHPERALAKRGHVLRRMVKEGFLSAADAETFGQAPIVLADPQPVVNVAPYFVEMVRQYLEATYGEESIYGEGMEVYSTLNLEMQAAANHAIETGLHDLDRRQGWRGPIDNILDRPPASPPPPIDADDALVDADDSGHPADPLASYEAAEWEDSLDVGQIVPGLITAIDGDRAVVRVGAFTGRIGPADTAWTRAGDPAKIFRPGDLAHFRIEAIDAAAATVRLTLDQVPEVQGALVAIDHATGEIKALVGGYDFGRSQFNRAVQSQRQSGSAFKPILYAAALEQGVRPSDTFIDEPTVFLQDPGAPAYQPENFLRRYFGRTTLREALEESRNIVSVKLFLDVGIEAGVAMAHRLGIKSRLHAVPSLVLGASEVNLLEITSAYGVFPNQGIHVEPHSLKYVVGGDGRLREEAKPQVREVLRADLAFVMNHLLQGVIENGTGRNARVLEATLAGKTGTTDDVSDAWFIGYTPSLVVGVWVGFDQKKTLGRNETGARAALPIWVDFFRAVLRDRPPETFQRPPNVVLVPIDRHTGLRASIDTGCSDIFLEAFVRGSEPADYCSEQEHFRLTLPYYLQDYRIDRDRRMEIPPGELVDLLAGYPHDLALIEQGRFLQVRQPRGKTDLRLELSLNRRQRQTVLAALAVTPPPRIDPATEFWEWAQDGQPYGLDGRPASVRQVGEDS